MLHWNYRQLCTLLLLVLCCSLPITTAMHLLHKDLMIAMILGKLLKPRFVPIPIPLPFPFKIQKHTQRPYPVYSQSFSAHQEGSDPWSYDSGSNDLNGGVHALAELHSASENIDSLMQQLSLSPDVLKAGDSNDFQSLHGDFNEFGDFSNFHDTEEWWR